MQGGFKKIGNTEYISEWKSKGLSNEIVKSPRTANNSLAPALSYIGNKIRVRFVGSCKVINRHLLTEK